jgi:hypothetical protein
MLIKKLAVPLINEKLLMQATHCYIAVNGISLDGFEFFRSRIPPACKMEIVTGMDEPADPEVLKRILKHYTGRISFRVYLKNTFTANMFLLDLPFRKSVAFVGSGSFTLQGIKDHEAIFWKITDPKEIESLKSWFVGYFEFGETLSEQMISEYEVVYKEIVQRQILSREDKHDVMELTTRGFSWDAIKFKLQCFKKEDYQILSPANSRLSNPVVVTGREHLKEKVFELGKSIERDISLLKLTSIPEHSISQLSSLSRSNQRVSEIGLAFGRSDSNLRKYPADIKMDDFVSLQFVIRQKEIRIALLANPGFGRIDRENMVTRMSDPIFKTNFHTLLSTLGPEFKIEIAGQVQPSGSFQNEEAFNTFLQGDDWKYFKFWIGRSFLPGDPAISSEKIQETIVKTFSMLMPLYEAIKHEA